MHEFPSPPQARLAGRLRESRARGLIGREHYLAEFRAALAGEPGAYAVCFLYGPGGIGKSSLLRRFKDEAEEAGRTVIEIDGRTEPSPAEFFVEAETAHTDHRTVVLIDTFEKCEVLEDWLRDRFLPQVKTGVVVVVAGRRPPAASWTSDVAWAGTLQVMELDGLSLKESAALLDARGVRPELRDTIAAFAGGNPLALSLMAEAAARIGASHARWRPTQDFIAPLMGQLVGPVPSETHRVALTVLTQARVTTEALLQTVMSKSDAAMVFDWLIQQPYVELGPRGIYPHDIVRGVLEADLRWRNQQRYAEIYNRIWPYLLQVGRAATGSDVLPAMQDLSHLLLPELGEEDRYFFSTPYEGQLHEAAMNPEDRHDVLAMAAETEGPESIAILDFWLQREPECVRLYRSESGALVAFMVWIRLRAGDREALQRDPVAAAAWAHATETGALRAHEHIRIDRFLVYPASYHRVSARLHPMQLRIMAEWVQAENLACSYVVPSDPDYWRRLMDHAQHRPVPQRPRIDGVEHTLFGRNWEHVPLEHWFADRYNTSPTTQPAGAMNRLSRTEFDSAVRHALGSWRSTSELAANPLRHAKLVRHSLAGQPVDEAAVAGALRDVLGDAVSALREDPRTVKMHRAVAATYLEGSRTQQSAAHRLNLPFSTYRRHLTRGLDQICEILWKHELKPRPLVTPEGSTAVRVVV
ncbi:ATP-binding protein [Micromonospora sp. NBC_00858]|uniref:ATP-binding protein n=1 Tax=Micromonospora sp. NBC_00858 TaxID=2975979 RepID=UPI00386D2BCA|nr:ATP-binding protein [Micromonospora sp. NBC_00858]